MKDLLPNLSDKRAAVATVVGAAAGTVAVAVVLHQRRSRQRAAAAAAAADGFDSDSDCEESALPLPSPEITSLEQLHELQQRSAVAAWFAPPVLSVRVTQQGVKVASIPPAVCALRQLRQLDLSGNALGAVPAAIRHLSALTHLNLSDNLITDLPPQIGELQALLTLDVSRNRLSRLPDTIGSLGQLKSLNAMANQLTALPDSIGGCTALLNLGLKSNRLAALPASIGQLASLVQLYITDNMLETLPAEMGGMTSLVKLQASFNPLKALPAELGSLPRLEMLRAACCDIQQIPASISDAPRLSWMSLASNPACRVLVPRKPPMVELSDLQMGRKLGEGASGEVYEAVWKGQRVAVKIFVKERSPDGHSKDEMAVAFALSERHLVRVMGQLHKPLGLVMQFAEGHPIAFKPTPESLLRCRWAPGEAFQLGWVLRVAIGVAGALEHMHYRGICHGDVYAHNVMVDEHGHATLCDYGASFPYHKGGRVRYEAQEVRAFGIMLADLVTRLDIGFTGMEAVLECQRELLGVVQICTTLPPVKRPTFGAVGRRLRAIQKQAARAGLADVTPRGDGSLTPRTCMTEAFSPRSTVVQF